MLDGHEARAGGHPRGVEGELVHRGVAVDEPAARLVDRGEPLHERGVVHPQDVRHGRGLRGHELDRLVEAGIAQPGEGRRQTRRTLGVANTDLVLSTSLMGDDQDHARTRS